MNKRFLAVSILILALMITGAAFFRHAQKIKIEQRTEAKYADNPVMLYRTVGIEEYRYDYRHKGEHSGAVRLEGDDLARAISFLESRFSWFCKGVTAVLYINAPKATAQHRGQPALLPLKKKDGKYYALGVVGSYSTPFLLELENKYQKEIEK